jgi:hypothetical protein
MSKKESTAVAEVEQKTTALAVGGMDFAADAGAGMEGAGQE